MRSKASILAAEVRVRLLSSKESHLEEMKVFDGEGKKSRTDGRYWGPYTWRLYLCESKIWNTDPPIALVDAQLHILVLPAKNAQERRSPLKVVSG